MILKFNRMSKTVDVFYGEKGWWPWTRLAVSRTFGKVDVTPQHRTPRWVVVGAKRILQSIFDKRKPG